MLVRGAGGAAQAPDHSIQDKKLKQACEDFEAIFLQQLLKSMRKTVVKSGLMDSSGQGEIFRDMLDAEVAKSAAKTHSAGIADLLYKQLSKPVAGADLDSNPRGENR